MVQLQRCDESKQMQRMERTNFNLGQKRKSEETMQKHYMAGESLYGGIHESMQMQRMDVAH